MFPAIEDREQNGGMSAGAAAIAGAAVGAAVGAGVMGARKVDEKDAEQS